MADWTCASNVSPRKPRADWVIFKVEAHKDGQAGQETKSAPFLFLLLFFYGDDGGGDVQIGTILKPESGGKMATDLGIQKSHLQKPMAQRQRDLLHRIARGSAPAGT